MAEAAPVLAGVEAGGVGPLYGEPGVLFEHQLGGVFSISEWWLYWEGIVGTDRGAHVACPSQGALSQELVELHMLLCSDRVIE